MAVHDHGPEEGRGLLCNELVLPTGERRGSCIITEDEIASVRVAAKPAAAAVERPPVFTVPPAEAAEKILHDFLTSIPAVRDRAAGYARSLGRSVDLRILTSAASDAMALEHDSLLTLVQTTIDAVAGKPSVTAEEAWAEHSIGMVWDSKEHHYGEYRQFLSGFEYRGSLPA